MMNTGGERIRKNDDGTYFVVSEPLGGSSTGGKPRKPSEPSAPAEPRGPTYEQLSSAAPANPNPGQAPSGPLGDANAPTSSGFPNVTNWLTANADQGAGMAQKVIGGADAAAQRTAKGSGFNIDQNTNVNVNPSTVQNEASRMGRLGATQEGLGAGAGMYLGGAGKPYAPGAQAFDAALMGVSSPGAFQGASQKWAGISSWLGGGAQPGTAPLYTPKPLDPNEQQ